MLTFNWIILIVLKTNINTVSQSEESDIQDVEIKNEHTNEYES